jgi:putative membrane protein
MSRNTLNLTPEDEKLIEQAISAAEKQTSGEIVPCIVDQSDSYDDAITRAGAIFVLAGLLIYLSCNKISPELVPDTVWIAAIISVLSGMAGLFLSWIFWPFRRLFISKKKISLRVYQRAMQAFLAEEIFKTKDRTGILIFISRLEHRVIVLGDKGINEKVRQSDWEDVVSVVISGIKNNQFTDGLIKAIKMCGDLLTNSGLDISPNDVNELGNHIRRG